MTNDVPSASTFVARLRSLREELAAIEPERFETSACTEQVEELAALEKSCSAAAIRVARHASSCGAHRAQGFVSPQDWVAKVTGTTSSAAREALRTVGEVERLPDTRDALASGDVSMSQAAEIVRTEAEVPGSEQELLDVARGGTLGALRTQARKRRVEAIPQEELDARRHAARELTHHRDELGMVCGSFRLHPLVGVPFVTRLERETNRRWREMRRVGGDESREALAADALAEMLAAPAPTAAGSKGGRTRRSSVNADVVIVQSIEVARRGHAHPGELCHIVGGGPVAPSAVEDLIASGAFVKAVLHDGEQVTHVAHYGRHLTAEMRTAIGLGPPPDFDGLCCSEDGCERRLGLEIDHVDPVANGSPTSLENLDPKCWAHHDAKTRRDRTAGKLRRGP